MRPLDRYKNAVKSGFSYLYSSAIHKVYLSGMPPAIGVELTNYCNLRCPECYSGSGMMTRSRGLMDIALFEKIMNELSPWLLNINLYFQGEPMMHPLFFDFIEMSRGLNTTVSTNGHFLTEESCEKLMVSRLSKLIISLDGFDQETYSVYRKGGDFNKVYSGIRLLGELKKKLKHSPFLELQCLVNSFNESQVPAMKKFASEQDITLRLKSMQVYDKARRSFWMPLGKKYRRYSTEGEEQSKKLPDRCARLWFNPVVTWDGKVVPCCFDKDAQYVMGELSKDAFVDIWHGDKFRDFRKMVLQKRTGIDICRNCTSGLKGIQI